eukprot:scaffold64092_cov30-Tisochrysis_lutea.AAC.3
MTAARPPPPTPGKAAHLRWRCPASLRWRRLLSERRESIAPAASPARFSASLSLGAAQLGVHGQVPQAKALASAPHAAQKSDNSRPHPPRGDRAGSNRPQSHRKIGLPACSSALRSAPGPMSAYAGREEALHSLPTAGGPRSCTRRGRRDGRRPLRCVRPCRTLPLPLPSLRARESRESRPSHPAHGAALGTWERSAAAGGQRDRVPRRRESRQTRALAPPPLPHSLPPPQAGASPVPDRRCRLSAASAARRASPQEKEKRRRAREEKGKVEEKSLEVKR